MNRKDIIAMALEAGFEGVYDSFVCDPEDIERFAAIVEAKAVAAEREACAKFVEDVYVRQFERPWREDLAAAIRARGQQ